MKFAKLAPLALGGVILAAGLTTVSVAQPAPPPAAAPGHPGHERMRDIDPAARAERRAEHLRATLQLRPEQETALKTFLAAHQSPQGGRGKMRGQREEMAKLSTPQRLDAQKARMVERQARFEQHAAATKKFYAQLSPAQQKAFDAMTPRGGGKGMRGHGGGPRGHMGQRG